MGRSACLGGRARFDGSILGVVPRRGWGMLLTRTGHTNTHRSSSNTGRAPYVVVIQSNRFLTFSAFFIVAPQSQCRWR